MGAAGEVKEEFVVNCAKFSGLYIRIEIGSVFFVYDVNCRVVYGFGVGYRRFDLGRYRLVDSF